MVTSWARALFYPREGKGPPRPAGAEREDKRSVVFQHFFEGGIYDKTPHKIQHGRGFPVSYIYMRIKRRKT